MELLPEAIEVIPEQNIPTVMYEDLGELKDAITKVREMIELPLKHPELFDLLGLMSQRGCCSTVLPELARPCFQGLLQMSLMPTASLSNARNNV
jgi:hypothetical protein